MKAIYTKYLGPTDTKGARVKAYDSPGGSMSRHTCTVRYSHELSCAEAHFAAVKAWAEKYGVPLGEMVGANNEQNNGYVFVTTGRKKGKPIAKWF